MTSTVSSSRGNPGRNAISVHGTRTCSAKSASRVVSCLFAARLCLVVLCYGLPLSSVLGQTPCSTPNPSTCGQWSATTSWPIEAVHAHLLPTTPPKVLVWTWPTPAPSPTPSPTPTPNVKLWDPKAGTFSDPAPLPDRLICSGHAFLSDGTLLVTGGHVTSYEGLNTTYIYNPKNNSWMTGLPKMYGGRWYPTTTALPGGSNGDALVISGQISGGANKGSYNETPQVWQAGAPGAWVRNLSTLFLPYYPYMFVEPTSGYVFLAGPVKLTRYLNTSANFSSTGTNWEAFPNNSGSIYGQRNWGSAVMYAPGKVLIMGGGGTITTKNGTGPCNFYDAGCTAPTNTAEFIDLTSGSPQWTNTTTSMANPRKLHNATLLPNGNVFVSGGTQSGTCGPLQACEYKVPASVCEVWTPPLPGQSGQGTWSLRASLPTYRGYHSIALLLPDGRVLSAGGEHGTSPPGFQQTSAEIYSPEYLFKDMRPTISSVSSSVSQKSTYGSTIIPYNKTFTISTSNLTGTPRVTMLALGSVTHGFNMGQRFIELQITANSGTSLTVMSPANSKFAPPGYYMLFVLNDTGVPSVATFIQLNPNF